MESNSHAKEILVNNDGALIYVKREWLTSCDEIYDSLLSENQWVYDNMKSPRTVECIDFSEESWLGKIRERLILEISDEFNSQAPGQENCFNYCLLNLFENGDRYTNPHAEKHYRRGTPVAVINLGTPRNFFFQKKKEKGESIKISLQSGDLCVVNYKALEIYNHSTPKSSKTKKGNIQLIFKTFP